MSTDPKSSVPAGATHQCTKCGAYWLKLKGGTIARMSGACFHPSGDVRPIAEAGPAPTTAAPAEQPFRLPEPVLSREDGEAALRDLAVMRGDAPAEQLSGKVVCVVDKEPHDYLRPMLGFGGCRDTAPAEQPGKATDPRPGEVLCDKPSYKHGGSHPKKVTCVDPRPAQPQAPAEQWRSPECQYELPRLLEIASRHVPQEAEAFVRDLRAAAEHFREHPPAAPSEAPLAEEPRCQAVTRNGHRCGKEPHEEGDDEHEADNAAEGGSTLVWTEHYPHAEAPLDALREALKHVQEELRDGFIVCSSCGHEEPTGDLDVLTVYIDPALSAPPPPGCKACALVAKEFGTDKCPWCGRLYKDEGRIQDECGFLHCAVRAAMGLEKPIYDASPPPPREQELLGGKVRGTCLGHLGPPAVNEPHPEKTTCFRWRAAPSSPEEQLSGKELK